MQNCFEEFAYFVEACKTLQRVELHCSMTIPSKFIKCLAKNPAIKKLELYFTITYGDWPTQEEANEFCEELLAMNLTYLLMRGVSTIISQHITKDLIFIGQQHIPVRKTAWAHYL